MLIWSGWGIIVPFIAMVIFIIAQILTNFLLGDEFAFTNAWSHLFASMFSGSILWILGKKINCKSEYVIIDKISKEERRLKHCHSFFFIPIQYWAFIFFAVGLIFAFLSMPSLSI